MGAEWGKDRKATQLRFGKPVSGKGSLAGSGRGECGEGGLTDPSSWARRGQR